MEAGPSSRGLDSPIASTNGHLLPSLSSPTTNGHSGTNGLQKNGKPPGIPRVIIPGTRLYEDMSIDREEFVRLVVQSLRDVGYSCVSSRGFALTAFLTTVD